MSRRVFIKNGLLLAFALWLWPLWGCTNSNEPPEKGVKKMIIKARPIAPSKTTNKPSEDKKTKITPTRKSLPIAKRPEDNTKRQGPAAEIKKRPIQDIKTKPAPVKVEEKPKKPEKMVKAEVPYQYNPKGRPDPFRPFITEAKAIPASKRERKRPLTPLERGELSQFKIVAILASGNDRHAMVEDGTGKGYIIKIGTYIGKNGGKVTEIFADHMVVEEQFVDIYGQMKKRRHAIKLRTSPGAGGRQ